LSGQRTYNISTIISVIVKSGLIIGISLLCTQSLAAQGHSTSLVIPPKSHAPIRKATGTHLFFAVGARTSVNNPQGVALTKLKSQDDPKTENDDDELTVYGVNAGHNEIIYNTSLIHVKIYRPHNNDPGAMLHPRGIAADAAGRVFVADMGHQRVIELLNTEQGTSLAFQQSGRPTDSTFAPFDVTLAEDSSVFVSDSAGSKIWRWYPNQHRWEIIADSVPTPLGIVAHDKVDRWTGYKKSEIGVVAKDGREVRIIDYTGKLVAQYQPDDSLSKFRYIAADYYNNYYVTDSGNDRVLKIDRNGKYVDTIGQKGKDDYEFLDPQGIAIWKRFGQVCIAESYAAQYYFIGTDILHPSISRSEYIMHLRFYLTERAKVTITRLSTNTLNPDTLTKQQIMPQGNRQVTYPIPQDLKPGKYTFQIDATPYYSSTRYFTASQQISWIYQQNSTKYQLNEEHND